MESLLLISCVLQFLFSTPQFLVLHKPKIKNTFNCKLSETLLGRAVHILKWYFLKKRNLKKKQTKVTSSLVVVFILLCVFQLKKAFKWINKCQGPVPWKMVKFNPGGSQILSRVFLFKNMQLELTKYSWAFTPRYCKKKTQNVTLSNTWECRIQKRDKILILD